MKHISYIILLNRVDSINPNLIQPVQPNYIEPRPEPSLILNQIELNQIGSTNPIPI